MKAAPLLAVAMLATACATASITTGPDGQPATAIKCDGSALGWDACYAKAAEVCGSAGFDILERSGNSDLIMMPSGSSVMGASVSRRTLLMRCKSQN